MSTQTPPGPKPGMQTVLPRRVCRAARTRELRDGIRSAKNTETKDERKVICTLPTRRLREEPIGILTAAAGTLNMVRHAGPSPGCRACGGACTGASACCLPYDVLLMSAIVDLAFPWPRKSHWTELRGTKAMMPAMARPTRFMLVPLIIATQMITRSRPSQG